MGVLLSELWKAWALPWKLVVIEGGRWRSAAALRIAVNRAVGREVEAQRDRGELALVVLILSRRRSRHHHLAFLGELAGIAQQVEQNLLQPHEGPRGQGAPRLSRASTPRAGSCSTVSWC